MGVISIFENQDDKNHEISGKLTLFQESSFFNLK